MVGRGAVGCQGSVMRFGGIADVVEPSVGREFFVQQMHEPVAGDLGDDGSRRDGMAMRIALDDGLVGPGRVRKAAVAVDEQEVRGGREVGSGAAGLAGGP